MERSKERIKRAMSEEIKNINEELEEKVTELDEATEAEVKAISEEFRSIVIEEAIEAILFAAGHPISYATLARVFDTTPTKIRDTVAVYALKYNSSELPRGVMLLTYTDSCQLCTKQHYLAEIRDALGIKKSGTLSSSALETLAIVAYNQPVTRLFVDTLRKVDSSYAMNSLIDRGLIECKGRLDVPGRPMLYGTTSDFLRCFGLPDLDHLPKTTDEMMDVFANAKLTNADGVSNESDGETLDGDTTQLTIDGVSEDTVDEVLLEEPSAEDDIYDDTEDDTDDEE